MFDPIELVAPHILKLKPQTEPYPTADGDLCLQADEHPYTRPFNRYRDLDTRHLLSLISGVTAMPAGNILLACGRESAFDLILRCFCRQGQDNVIVPQPEHPLYARSAAVAGVELRRPSLNSLFSLSANEVLRFQDKHTRVIAVSSPTWVAGTSLDEAQLAQVLDRTRSIVVVDETYRSLSRRETMRKMVGKYPNLVVVESWSKGWGAAGLRLATVFADKHVVEVLRRLQPSYTLSQPVIEAAEKIMSSPFDTIKLTARVEAERPRMCAALSQLPTVEKVVAGNACHMLVKFADAKSASATLEAAGVHVLDLSGQPQCEGCLRISLGSRDDNSRLLAALRR